MPLLNIEAGEAWENLRVNNHSSWPSKRRGGERLQPIAQPGFSSDFTLTASDKVFTIGSCFARNIEEALFDAGLEVITGKYAVPESEWEGRANGILNKYHPFAILNELLWAMDDSCPYPAHECIVEVSDGQWVDLHLPGNAKPVSYERAVQRREEMYELYQQVRNAGVVIITPGLIEAWWDKQAKYYVNRAIPRSLIQKYPGRFELHVLSYEEVYGALTSAVELLRRHGLSGVRIFFSVSPVPMAATFTNKDVLLANSYSKSVLRAAVEQVVTEHSGCAEYFPSYESITLSSREEVYGDDGIHVKDKAVRENILRFMSALKFDLSGVDEADNAAQRVPIKKTPKPLRGMVSTQLHGNAVTGWAVRNGSNRPARVRLLINGELVGECDCTEMRKALLVKAMHETGYCGFSIEAGRRLEGGETIQVMDNESEQQLRNSPFTQV